ARGLLDHDLRDPAPLLAGQVRELARAPGGHDPVHAAVEDVAHDAPQRALVHVSPVGRERRWDRGDHAAELTWPHRLSYVGNECGSRSTPRPDHARGISAVTPRDTRRGPG